MKPQHFGKNLKEVMKFLGINQYQLSVKTGLTPAAISHFVTGARSPNLANLCKILEAVPVPFERLVK
jgi:transcriptional regulator with XRE-family HTH domain